MKVADRDLVQFSKCSLLDIEGPSLVFQAALRTLRWTLINSACSQDLNKQNITNKFEEEITKLWANAEKTAAYWNLIRIGRKVISKIYKLYRLYKVIQPITSYSHSINGYDITGEYAIIQRRKGYGPYWVLNVIPSRLKLYDKPHIDMLCKWLHAKTYHLDIGVFNLPLLSGKEWKTDNLFEPVVYNWIYSIIGQIKNKLIFPVIGNHCNSCVSKKCKEGFINVGSNDYPWEG